MDAQTYYRSIRADRETWRAEQLQRCMNCLRQPGRHYPGRETPGWLEIHEICSRAHLPNAWWFRGNGLLLCHWCHQKVAAMSHAAQLAIKLREDPENYDLREWLTRRNPRAMNYVTDAEVRQYLNRRSA